MQGRQITTHEAVIKKAAVEIKTLSVSGKQMTLAVFRQLIKEPLIDKETGALNGAPWGKVNYFWNGCSFADSAHLHIVWQKGDELRRDCVYPKPKYEPYSRHPKAVQSPLDTIWANQYAALEKLDHLFIGV